MTMTQPYPPQYGQQAPPAPQQYAPPQYTAQQPQGYPVGPPAGPQYAQQPQQYGYPQNQPGYGQQYAQPQYGAPQQAQQPVGPPPVAGTLAGFFSQPSIGWGPTITPNTKTPDGTQVLMVVARWMTNADVEHATKFQSQEPDFYRNGQAKLNLKVPVFVAAGQTYTEGSTGALQTVADQRAMLLLKGSDKDLLGAAIAAAGGNPADIPELGAIILVTKTNNRPNRSGTQSAVKTFQYWRPGPEAQQFAVQNGIQYPDLNTPRPVDEGKHAAPEATPAPVSPAPAVSAGPPVQQQAALPQPPAQPQAPQTGQPQGMPAAPAGPPAQFGPPQGMPPAPAAAPAPQAPGMPPAPGVPAAGPIAGMSPDKAELMARLTGQAPAPAA